jgi:hypothetical protein
VPGFFGPFPPPHATIGETRQISKAANANSAASLRPDFFAMMAARANIKSNPNHKAKNGARGLRGENIGKTEDGAVVEMVRVELALPGPGVTLGDENEQDESDGNPEQARETGFVNAPKLEPTFIVYEADCPGETLALGCTLATVKSVTAIWRVLVGSDVVTPPLLTVSVSVSFPMGHIMLALSPDAVPQLPDQLSVSGQLSGSVPDPLRVTLAPFALVAFTV